MVIWATKNNELVFEFKGEGCHSSAKSQENGYYILRGACQNERNRRETAKGGLTDFH